MPQASWPWSTASRTTGSPQPNRVPLPPPSARVYATVCDYCIVGCGYRVFVWPEGEEGGHTAGENAMKVDMPTEGYPAFDDLPARFEGWASPNQHTVVMVGGRRHHVVIQPDPHADVVNRRGNHSIRGACWLASSTVQTAPRRTD